MRRELVILEDLACVTNLFRCYSFYSERKTPRFQLVEVLWLIARCRIFWRFDIKHYGNKSSLKKSWRLHLRGLKWGPLKWKFTKRMLFHWASRPRQQWYYFSSKIFCKSNLENKSQLFLFQSGWKGQNVLIEVFSKQIKKSAQIVKEKEAFSHDRLGTL